ncbi:MAG TPA: UDP-N-acetylmuramoyl-tripeptide--D-alanyl-D-alanine ligase [Bacteroidia bacterium]|nr:UDP-N-acetylmuramoyl-tripeptide--D-alanyl-D-alanine ligase [Bacteroidia bacterium]
MSPYTSLEELYACYLQCGGQISTDTRKLYSGSLFVALRGDKFNANTFASEALKEACAFAIVDDPAVVNDSRMKLVENSLTALQDLARHHRKQFSGPILGITGSNGKTTNKELIHAVLSKKYHTLSTAGNLNNHIGVPLTLLQIRSDHQFAIIEMGANHQGEIAQLCRIADPDYGIITNIGKAHLEGFGGPEGVIKGKSEMYTHLRQKNGKVFLNADDKLLRGLAHDMSIVAFGSDPGNFIYGAEISGNDKLRFWFGKNEEHREQAKQRVVQTQLIGSYNLPNCLAAACIGIYFGVPEKDVVAALEQYSPEMNRSQLFDTGHNRLILDAYNANPSSMQSAIQNFASLGYPNKMLILGDMFELGEFSQDEHQKLIDLLQSLGFTTSQVILVGETFAALGSSRYTAFRNTGACGAYLKSVKPSNQTILIKGSRGMKLEELKELL